jgi:hypothetical protein
MKIRKRLGSDAVQDIVREASERADPSDTVRDPWQSPGLGTEGAMLDPIRPECKCAIQRLKEQLQ